MTASRMEENLTGPEKKDAMRRSAPRDAVVFEPQ